MMTENKRFVERFQGDIMVSVKDTQKNKPLNLSEMIDLLNELNDENKQLTQEYLKLDHRHGLLHDECLDVECERDSLKKDVESLEKENEQLKQALNRNIEVKEFLLEEELELNDTARKFIKEHNKERYK